MRTKQITTKRHGESTLSGSDNRNATTTFPAFFEFILFWNQRQKMNLEVGAITSDEINGNRRDGWVCDIKLALYVTKHLEIWHRTCSVCWKTFLSKSSSAVVCVDFSFFFRSIFSHPHIFASFGIFGNLKFPHTLCCSAKSTPTTHLLLTVCVCVCVTVARSWLTLTTDIVAGQFPLGSSVLLQHCIIQIQIHQSTLVLKFLWWDNPPRLNIRAAGSTWYRHLTTAVKGVL